MINKTLFSPSGIVVVGGSENISKPGGKIVKNIVDGGYTGNLFVINPGRDMVQGVASFSSAKELPGDVDLAILAITAHQCPAAVRELAELRNTRAFIVISAGFSEEGEEGALLENELRDAVNSLGGTLIGPNCIGVITPVYNGVFTSPVPRLNPAGCDFVSGSGATAVFILESALPKGLTFSSIITVGNSAQTGIEEVLEYWDESFDVSTSSKIKLIYVENIQKPDKLLKHATSLINKGCRIAAIKSGVTDAGQRATSSHTGAMASADSAVEALFRKAGIVRCFGREELTTVASVFMYNELRGKNLVIITQAGGPGVMLTDALSDGGLNIPALEGADHDRILKMLNPGSSASNPIDILATGTAEQLGKVIDYCDNEMDEVDGMIIIFGSTGLTTVYDAFDMIHEKMQNCRKPVFPILPSISSARSEVEEFLAKGHINFPDEVVLGKALTSVHNTPKPAGENVYMEGIDITEIRRIVETAMDGFQEPGVVGRLLKAAGIPIVEEGVAATRRGALRIARRIGYPVALKVIGPVHKSDVGGVTLNIKTEAHLNAEYRRMRKIKGVNAVLVQKMQSGMELFIGAKYEPRFGHVVLCGLGGIFVEALGDHSHGLAPLTFDEARSMIRSLKSYPIIQGIRGTEGVNEDLFAEIIVRLSTLLRYATEIKEIDLNPLLGNQDYIRVVDARMLIEKT
ncbi:acetate--CoA ligase family protein [Alkalitalea saponilacus]|uniref:Acetyltransferase n=1 Tax=Alkalitalea saponilacus TaxID=889453 RepID=A0A1T5GB20_9BACT|nr:acetate--CoA ligase [Alkalitalea saponilacus]ASB47917.1 CoA ligase [Alkalitalea saponilacus]SKC05644.1 acetyltransferase [Alkalitalea saponilacus]